MYCTANIIWRAQDVSDIVTGLINQQDAPAPIWLCFIHKNEAPGLLAKVRRLLQFVKRDNGSHGLEYFQSNMFWPGHLP
jgi:hypothetical protein